MHIHTHTHTCTHTHTHTHTQLFMYEALGLCPEGEGGSLIDTAEWIPNKNGQLLCNLLLCSGLIQYTYRDTPCVAIEFGTDSGLIQYMYRDTPCVAIEFRTDSGLIQ